MSAEDAVEVVLGELVGLSTGAVARGVEPVYMYAGEFVEGEGVTPSRIATAVSGTF